TAECNSALPEKAWNFALRAKAFADSVNSLWRSAGDPCSRNAGGMFYVRTAAWHRLERMKRRWRSAEFHSVRLATSSTRSERSTRSRVQLGDTAECNSALREKVFVDS